MSIGQSVLVTGGTGSFGKKFIDQLLKQFPSVKRIVVFSRDELKQFEMSQLYPAAQYPQLRFFIGDVRDKGRLYQAVEGIESIVHAAALKQVPACEYNPFEAIKTNILGAQNVIEVALERGVKRVVALSTDKAAAPINLYGATKLCSDKLFVSANNFRGSKDIRFSVVRYGNVMGSRGSVIPFFLARRNEEALPITDSRMTRFNITLNEGVDLVLHALENMWGGEIFVPKIPSYRITDVASAIAPEARLDIIGIRPGEKLHEEMITENDSFNAVVCRERYVILPSAPTWNVNDFIRSVDGERCADGFSYNSGTNSEWLTVDELRDLIRKHVDPTLDVGTVPLAISKRRLSLRLNEAATDKAAEVSR